MKIVSISKDDTIQGGPEKNAIPVICNFNSIVDRMPIAIYFIG